MTRTGKLAFGESTDKSLRCKPCNNLRGRIHTALGKRDSKFVRDFQSMTADDKQKWMLANHAACGRDLDASMTTAVTEIRRATLTYEFKAQGNYITEKQLEEDLKDAPEELASMKAKAESFTHPTRGCKMYEDLICSTVRNNKFEQSTEQRKELETTRTLKRVKAAKALGNTSSGPVGALGDGPADADPPAVIAKPLTEPQKKKIGKLKEQMVKQIEALKASLDKVAGSEELTQKIPPFIMRKANVSQAKAIACLALMDVMLEASTSPGLKAALADFEAAKKDVTGYSEKMKIQIEMAEEDE